MRSFFVFIFVGTSTFAAADDLDAEAVVEHILARSEGIQSGIFEVSVTNRMFNLPPDAIRFRVIVEDKGTESERRRIGFLDTTWNGDFPYYQISDLVLSDEWSQHRKITVAGDNWVAHNPAVPSTLIERPDFTATYTERTPVTGDVQRYLLLEPASGGLTHSDVGSRWRQFLQCGTVPNLIHDFIANRRKPYGIRKKDDLIEMCWRLSQRELDQIFGKATPVFLYAGPESILNLTTVPSMGYVLSEIHFLSLDLRKQVSFVSTGFKDAGNGVYFPTRCEYSCVSPLNLEQVIYDFKSVSGVNDPPPPGAFELTLKPGTRVRSTLPGHEAVFTLADTAGEISISEALNHIPEEYSPTPPGTRRPVVLSVSIGIGLFLVISVLIYARTRTQKSRE